MFGYVGWGSAPGDALPSQAQRSDVEIAQADDLDLNRRRVVTAASQGPSRHRSTCRLGSGGYTLRDAVNADIIAALRDQIELELLANDAGEKAADRMLLPRCCFHNGIDGCLGGALQHRQ